MSVYLTINLFIIIFPLLLTFLPEFKFYQKFKPLLFSILLVGGFFLLWDMLATLRGDWSFNPLYTGGIQVFNLPLEEVLFFVAVPYSCLFLYEGLVKIILEKQVFYNRYLYFVMAGLAFLAAFIFAAKSYSLIIFMLTGILFLAGGLWLKKIFSSLLFWVWLILVMLLFIIFNYFLTSLPVVVYNPNAILGLRILTIPIEDFFYNYSLLTLYLAAYLFVRTSR